MERSIGYVRRSFHVPFISRYRQLEQALDLERLNLEFARWLALTANARTHGTTGEVPSDRLAQEREVLQPLPGGTAASASRRPAPGEPVPRRVPATPAVGL